MIKDTKLEAENILGEYNSTTKKMRKHKKKVYIYYDNMSDLI